MTALLRAASRLYTSCSIRRACQCIASIMKLAINRLVSPKYGTHVCGVIRMLCTKHLLQQSAVGRRWRSACGTAGGRQNDRQTNPACERHRRNLKTVPCAFQLRNARADGLASWLRNMTCCWQRQKLPHALRWPSTNCDFVVISFRMKATMLGGRGPCPTSYN